MAQAAPDRPRTRAGPSSGERAELAADRRRIVQLETELKIVVEPLSS
jgi:hypothetical protein